MTTVAITAAKGGVGCSILATNLAGALTRFGSVGLVDLHPGGGVDDLLLNLTPEHTWDDLLPVAIEITPRHFEIARTLHATGLELYAAPKRWDTDTPSGPITQWIHALDRRVDWTILDLQVGLTPLSAVLMPQLQKLVLTSTADPVALRGTTQLFEELPVKVIQRTGLVLTQFTRRHPAKPRQLAEGMGIELIATLPSDVRAVGYQVNFGHACVLDRHSGYGRAVRAFADRLNRNLKLDPRSVKRVNG